MQNNLEWTPALVQWMDGKQLNQDYHAWPRGPFDQTVLCAP